MTTRAKVEVAAALVAVGLGLVGGREWLIAHDAAIRAASQAQAAQQAIAAAQKQIEGLKADSDAKAQQLTAQLAAFEAEKQKPATPQDLAALLNAVLPKSAPPVTVVPTPPASGASPSASAALPNAPAVQIPEPDVQPLRDAAVGCAEDRAKAATCAQQLGDAQGVVQQQQTQLQAATAEAAQWKKAAKGGSWLARVGRDVKCLVASGAGSAAGAALDKGSPWRGAALGAVAGGMGCRIF